MLKHSFYAAVVSATLIGISSQAGPVGIVPGRILVKAAKGHGKKDIGDVVDSLGGNEVDEIPNLGVHIIHLPPEALEHALKGLQHNPNIEFAEPDAILAPDAYANDPYFSSQWHLAKIQAPTAWDTTTGSSAITIAIIDSGVDASHPDLAGKIVPGWNFYDGNSNTSDVYGHGTAVAGTAAANSNNGFGVAGVAWNCKIMPVRISDTTGYAYFSTIAQGLTWAADHGARVANISYQVSTSSAVTSAAQYFQSKGGVVTASAGNSGVFDASGDNPYILTVSATDSIDAITSWSNTGNNIDLAAPGDYIMTTVAGGSYGAWAGTSFSAPIVAGAAALVLSVNPGLTGAQVADVVRNSADDLGAVGYDTRYGYGRVNVSRAVALASTYSAPPPPPAPAPAPTPADSTTPSIGISSPTAGSSVGTSVSVYVSASDNVGVTKVELYVDGQLTGSSTSSPFTTKWNARKASKGTHQLQCKAYDAAGNSALSPAVSVNR